ncbi:TMEM14 family protein [Leptolyngbya sp. FACHB-261]|uniref:TMEM14 family protein n=1 Tax=Leptolyngbya sp. FACHB-261 TaxID=2692806 RepID=UPI0016836DCF|nr:TMEM14 family protein [Leptolyngbya sp. FACHB-261]MBD2103754.1 TMEM14 family protein [Leptolyngbya sp. FACHB-261]
MIISSWVAAIYGLLSLVGGIVGYRKSASRASLIAGSISGGLLLLAAWLMQAAASELAFWGALVVMLFLAVFFALRLQKTRKFMPAGLMAGLGLLSAILLGLDRAGLF